MPVKLFRRSLIVSLIFLIVVVIVSLTLNTYYSPVTGGATANLNLNNTYGLFSLVVGFGFIVFLFLVLSHKMYK